jgi:hypothetical protein
MGRLIEGDLILIAIKRELDAHSNDTEFLRRVQKSIEENKVILDKLKELGD